MAGFVARKSGFFTVGDLMLSVVKDMKDNGFNIVHPAAWVEPTVAADRQNFTVLMEAGQNVDPLNPATGNKQPWRIRLQVYDSYTAGLVVGTQISLPDNGNQSWMVNGTDTIGPIGAIGEYYTEGTGINRKPKPATSAASGEGFINRKYRVTTSGAGSIDLSTSYPMSYYLAITPRGFFLSVWEDYTTDTSAIPHAWILVQRPVDRKTGMVITTGKAPVFCLCSVAGVISKIVVRESDVLRPSNPYDATKDTVNSAAVINALEQVAVSEDNKYVVSFPSRLNTPRYAYTYELDMIGYTSADVVAENTQIPLRVYGEASDRKFVAMHASKSNNTGMRIVALTQGGGIS